MNKTTKIIIAVVAVMAVVAGIYFICSKGKDAIASASNLEPITSNEDLTALVNKIYEGVNIEMPMLMSQPVDVTDADAVKYMTGLDNGNDIEYAVVSEPMMSSQAYSLVLVKVKQGANVEAVAKKMNENIDNRKWICVTAEKVYTTSSGDVVCLVMSKEDTAKAVYNNFKTIAGGIGEEYERTAEEIELPEDMLPGADLEEPAYNDDAALDNSQEPAAEM